MKAQGRALRQHQLCECSLLRRARQSPCCKFHVAGRKMCWPTLTMPSRICSALKAEREWTELKAPVNSLSKILWCSLIKHLQSLHILGKSIIALSLSLGEVFLRFCFIGIYFSVPCFFLNVFLFPPWNYSELIIQSFVQKISSPHIYLSIRLFMSRWYKTDFYYNMYPNKVLNRQNIVSRNYIHSDSQSRF